MATKKGVWSLQQVRDKSLQSLWSYGSTVDPGTLWTMGSDAWGLLGQNTSNAHRSSPVQIPGTTWSIINNTYQSQAAIKSDGTLWTWGKNYGGILGLNESGPWPSNTGSRSSPTQVPGTTWANVAVAEQSTYAIKTDGTLWGWGTEGNWGSPSGSPAGHRSSPTQVGTGETWATGKGKLANWTSAHAAINSSGELFTWGRNYTGSLGQNQSAPVKYSQNDPDQVGSDTNWDIVGGETDQGWKGFIARKTDGTLWTCGSGGSGQLGQNNRTNYSSPVQIPGTTWSKQFTGNEYGRLAIKTDGTLWAWGDNEYGQLAQNNRTDYSSPVQVGSDTTWSVISASAAVFAIKTDGTLWAWGEGGYGELGHNNVVKYSSPVQVGSATDWNPASCHASGWGASSSLRYA